MARRVFERILDVWAGAGSYGARSRWLFAAALVGIFACTVFTGAVPTFRFGHDIFFFLDGGWRALYGQRPHLDFSSPWGPFPYLLVAMGLKLSRTLPNGIGYGSAILGLVIGLWTYRIGRDRLAAIPRALLALYGALLTSAPYPLGLWPTLTSHAMAYNRWAYALLVLVILECFQNPQTERESWIEGISTGVAAALAFYLKVSFFGVAAVIIVASLVLRKFTLQRITAIALGFGSIGLIGMIYLRFQFRPMLNAFHDAAIARSEIVSWKTPLYAVQVQLMPLALLAGLIAVVTLLEPRRVNWLGTFRLAAAALLVYGGDILLFTSNAQGSALPLVPVIALLIANRIAESKRNSDDVGNGLRLAYHSSLLVLAGLLFIPPMIADAAGVAYGVVRKARPTAACAVRFTEPRLGELMLCDRPDENQPSGNGRVYTTYVNDGTSLLRRCCDSSDKILTIDQQNPFPFAMGWPPARGGMASISLGLTVSIRTLPSFDDYLGDATVVMVPKHPAQVPQLIEPVINFYFPAVQQRFQLVAESEWWWVYRK